MFFRTNSTDKKKKTNSTKLCLNYLQGLPIYPILGMFGAERFDAILLPG